MDAVSQSFVESAADIEAVRAAAANLGKHPFIIAKIERADALERFDEILQAADGIMVARGDLGVEVPIEQMAILQKQLIARASLAGKPVITATQMLESMTHEPPANPGRVPPTSPTPSWTARTASCFRVNPRWEDTPRKRSRCWGGSRPTAKAHQPRIQRDHLAAIANRRLPDTAPEAIAELIEHALDMVSCAAVFVPTRTGTTARMISRFNPPVWVIAVSEDAAVCQGLAFAYGVHAVHVEKYSGNLERGSHGRGWPSGRSRVRWPCS